MASLRTEELRLCFLLIVAVPFCDSPGFPKWLSGSFNTQLGLLLVCYRPLGFFSMLKEEKKLHRDRTIIFMRNECLLEFSCSRKAKQPSSREMITFTHWYIRLITNFNRKGRKASFILEVQISQHPGTSHVCVPAYCRMAVLPFFLTGGSQNH